MIPKSHPRYESLMTRELIVRGVKEGITSTQGLIAQGRGEAFDYLIGEKSTDYAILSEKAAAAHLLLARKPVISVNGNAAALVPEEIIMLSELVNAPIEVNLFHRTQERINKIIAYLQSLGAKNIFTESDALIPGITHERAKVDSNGIFIADVVLVPLEDGDRCKALVDMGKTVIAIDLNPLSRTSRSASVSIIDNITRALPKISKFAEELRSCKQEELQKIIERYDNKRTLSFAIEEIENNLEYNIKSITTGNFQK